MYPYYYYHEMYRQTDKFIQDLTKAINGEYSAIQCYQRLASKARTNKERQQILEIRNDEKKHLQHFSQIYENMTGRKPQPMLIEGCPNDYKNGLEFAFMDEQKTVDFYLEIADDSTDPMIKQVFKRAAADEQNHAVWFLYFLTYHK